MVKDTKVLAGHVSNEEYLMQRRKQALQVRSKLFLQMITILKCLLKLINLLYTICYGIIDCILQ